MECVWDGGVPVQGSRPAEEVWAVLPAQLHGGREKLHHVHQEARPAGGAATPDALSPVQTAEHGVGAGPHRRDAHHRIHKEARMTVMDELLAVFQKKSA